MRISKRNALTLGAFLAGMTLILGLALTGTTWAAPGAQGTVPTPPKPTQIPITTPVPKPGGGGGNQKGGNAGAPTPVPTATNGCAVDAASGVCTGGSLTVQVGNGAAPAGTTLSIQGPLGQPPCPASPAGQNFVNQCYGLTWSGVSTFSAPVQYCIGYGPDQLAAVTNKPESFLIGFAGADGNWAFVKPTVDAPNQRICAASDRLLAWAALFAPQTATAVLPTVGDPFEPGWLLAWGILGSVLVLGAGLILRRQFPLSK